MIFRKNLKQNEEKREYLKLDDGSYTSIAANDSLSETVVLGGLGKAV